MKTFENDIKVGQRYKDVRGGEIYEVVNIILSPILLRRYSSRAQVIKKRQKIDGMVLHIYMVNILYSGSYSPTNVPVWPRGAEIIDQENFSSPIKGIDLRKKSRIYQRGLKLVDRNGALRVGFHTKLVLCPSEE